MRKLMRPALNGFVANVTVALVRADALCASQATVTRT